jgi:hypothetical protein
MQLSVNQVWQITGAACSVRGGICQHASGPWNLMSVSEPDAAVQEVRVADDCWLASSSHW